jgi:Fanconi-associated nuclease 1
MDRFIQRSKPNKTRVQPATGSLVPKLEQRLDEPPRKRVRLAEVQDSDDEDGDSSLAISNGEEDEFPSHHRGHTLGESPPASEVEESDLPRPKHQTAFENSLPAVATDKEAIEEYEAMRASQASQDEADNASSRIDTRQWVRGKSSIYVDAFNLALDTVLEDESHLFDAEERCVFEQWRGLSYEAQYL